MIRVTVATVNGPRSKNFASEDDLFRATYWLHFLGVEQYLVEFAGGSSYMMSKVYDSAGFFGYEIR